MRLPRDEWLPDMSWLCWLPRIKNKWVRRVFMATRQPSRGAGTARGPSRAFMMRAARAAGGSVEARDDRAFAAPSEATLKKWIRCVAWLRQVRDDAASGFVLDMLGDAFFSNRDGAMSKSALDGKVLGIYIQGTSGPNSKLLKGLQLVDAVVDHFESHAIAHLSVPPMFT